MAATNIFANVFVSGETQRLRWNGRTIRVAVSTSLYRPSPNIKTGSDVAGAIARSLQKWASVADIDFIQDLSDKQSVSPAGATGDGISLITIAQTPENVLFFLKDPNSASAKTRVFYNRRGFITEGDIVLNPFQQFSTDGTFGTFDLGSVLTHEIGHLLGLRHSNVMGAVMSDGSAMNGVFGTRSGSSHLLAQSDISSVREIYGAKSGNDDCCARINGKLTLNTGRPAVNAVVWAEDRSGRVVAQVGTSSDGSFRLGGLMAGVYSVFWRDVGGTLFGQFGNVILGADESRSLSEKVRPAPSSIVLTRVGINGELADLAAPLNIGRTYTVYLGGLNLKPNGIDIDFHSPFLSISRNSVIEHDYGNDISVISFDVNVDEEAPVGTYSIFVTGAHGEKTCLIGALSVNRWDNTSQDSAITKD